MSGEDSGCLSWPPAGTSPPSSWCSMSGSWTRTPEGLTLRVIEIKCYDFNTFGLKWDNIQKHGGSVFTLQ